MITATTSPAFQQVQSARLDTQTGDDQSPEIQRYNINVKEHNQQNLYSPKVRQASWAEISPPQAGGRGSNVNISA